MAAGHEEMFEKLPPDAEKGWGGSVTYNCYWDRFKRPSLTSVFKWKFTVKNESNIPTDSKILDRYMPVLDIDRDKLSQPPGGGMQVTWFGHATVLVQFDGISVLSDPLFRDFCGPEQARYISKLGYQRYRKAAGDHKNIPELDVVIISHNHFDHLDRGSVMDLSKNHKNVTWFVPMGTKDWLKSHSEVKEDSIIEMTWWEEYVYKKSPDSEPVRFFCTPSQHWCQRGPFDLNKNKCLNVQQFDLDPIMLVKLINCLQKVCFLMLWSSWVVKGPTQSYYFAGDTGYYGPLFRKIGAEYGPFSLAAIPIGAYNPRWILGYQHSDPEDAVNIHTDIQSNQSIGMHWGTFKTMACEFFLEPPNLVKEHMEEKDLDHKKFTSLRLGETWTVGEEREESPFMGIKRVEDLKTEDTL